MWKKKRRWLEQQPAIDRAISLIFAVGPLVLLGRRVGLDLSIHDNQGKETNGAALVGPAFTCYPTEFPNPVHRYAQYSTVHYTTTTTQQRSRVETSSFAILSVTKLK